MAVNFKVSSVMMMRPRLDLNLLLALRVLLKERSVTRAAELVHLSQPAMSSALARLRDYFDDPLIAPIGRRMELTPLGEALKEPLDDVLVRIESALLTTPAFHAKVSRRQFRIVASDYVFDVLLLRVIERVTRDAPDVTVHLIPPSDGIAVSLESGEVDLLLTPERFASGDHPSCKLFEDDHCLIADAANESIGTLVTLDTFLSCRHVTFGHRVRPYFDSWFERHCETPRRVDLLVHNFMQLAQSVAGSKRVGVLLSRQARHLEKPLKLRLAKLAFGDPRLTFIMQWHQHRDHDPALQWLREVIRTEAANLPSLSAPS